MSHRSVIPLPTRPAGASLLERPDDELMQLAAAELPAAYGALVRRHQRALRAYCVRVCGNAALGEEVAQECLIEVWRQRHHYVPRGLFRAYLFTLAQNRCKNELRRKRREDAFDPERSLGADAVPPDQLDLLVAEQRRQRVERCLGKLPAAQRQTILLRFAADLEYPEIEQITGKTSATLRSRVFLGIARLRQLLK